jgi:flagellar protein FliO/FliZ
MNGRSPLLALAALALVLAMIWLARRALVAVPMLRLRLGLSAGQRPPLQAGARALALEQVLALDARRRLVLVRCGARQVVLLTGGAQDIVVGWLDAPADRTPAEAR